MKLNYDCVREVLLKIEEACGLFEQVSASNVVNSLSDYNSNDVIYSILKMEEAKYIAVNNIAADVDNAGFDADYYYITDITFAGHEYLNSVRDSKIWASVKREISSLSSVSLPIIQQLANAFILKHFHLQ